MATGELILRHNEDGDGCIWSDVVLLVFIDIRDFLASLLYAFKIKVAISRRFDDISKTKNISASRTQGLFERCVVLDSAIATSLTIYKLSNKCESSFSLSAARTSFRRERVDHTRDSPTNTGRRII